MEKQVSYSGGAKPESWNHAERSHMGAGEGGLLSAVESHSQEAPPTSGFPPAARARPSQRRPDSSAQTVGPARTSARRVSTRLLPVAEKARPPTP
ncbi:uncharacterized protein LOC144578150 isoform X3 [Callithrix jacchus]